MSEAPTDGGHGVAARPLQHRPQYSDEAAAYVRELIMSGQVRAGEYLRVDRVAGELGISATPVREGLLALRGEGFVALEPRRGFVVLPLRHEDVRDLFLVQAGLAGELAAKAATRVDDATLAELERLQSALEEAARIDDVDTIEVLNHRFHRAINLAAAAPKLAWFLSMATRYAPRRFYPTIRGWRAASVEDHRGVIDAMRRRDPEGARAAMYAHIMHAGDLLATHLDGDRRWT